MPVAFEPGRVIHIYRILRLLGEGGMGAVYEAIQDPIGRRVALKILHSQYASDPAVMNRFFNEARAVNMVAHPGLVQVSDFGSTADGTAYLVMELLGGDTLSMRLRRGRLEVDETLQILQQLTSALKAVHQVGIVHRDLKPSNVILTANPAVTGGEQAKIVDFGIAKLLEGDGGALKTTTGHILGTPQYMAPEQAKSPRVDGRADVYSVGAMAYEMLSGRMPYQMDPGEMVWALLARKMFDPPPELAQLEPELPKELTELVMTLLAREPGDRPTMAQLDSVLCRLRGIEPQRRSGIHLAVAPEDPVSSSVLKTVDSPRAAPLTPNRSPTVDEPPGAPPPHLISPPRPVSPADLGRGDGAVIDQLPSVSTAPISAKVQAPVPHPPAAAPPTPVAAQPAPAAAPPKAAQPAPAAAPPAASSPPTVRPAWLVGIVAVVVVEVIALAAYLAPSRSDKRSHGQQGRLSAVQELAAAPDLLAPAAPVDLGPPPDLAPSAASLQGHEAKPKAESPARAGHPAHCAAVTATEACLHGKNLSPELRRRILAALKDPSSKLRLCATDRLIVRIGDSGARLVDAPERLAAKVQTDFEHVLDGHLDGISHFGEIAILCSAPVH